VFDAFPGHGAFVLDDVEVYDLAEQAVAELVDVVEELVLQGGAAFGGVGLLHRGSRGGLRLAFPQRSASPFSAAIFCTVGSATLCRAAILR
jgi:hypothetical protein